ncbi:MAG TPA: TIM44-like domain-containing protein [Phenylobacterium sp.]
MTRLSTKLAAAFGVALALGMLAAEPADARRGGSFGSRGMRTYSAPRSTATAPGYVPPVQRSMTPNSGFGANPGAYAPRPGYPGYAGYAPRSRFGGSGGGFLGGLVTGGLIGGMMGHGWGGGYGGYGGGGWGGGGGGLLTVLIQLLVLGLILSFVLRLFRRRAAYATPFAEPEPFPGPNGFGGGFGGPFGGGSGAGFGGTAVPTGGPAWEIPITPADQQAFEQLLAEVQGAFAREDYAALREHCTPEVMGYLAEELSDNATHGRKNDVSNLRLLQADVGEAWREGPIDYATASMRYESIDVMRDRASGKVISGDPDTPTQTTELWTFARPQGGTWKLSAIQET